MKNKQGYVAVIALIIVIVAITAGVVGWMFAKKSQAPVQQAAATQPTAPVAQTQPASQPIQQQATQPASAQAQTTASTITQPTTGPISDIIKALDTYSRTKSMHFNGDTKVDITSFNQTKTAAKGKWWAGDAWYWISWKDNSGNWVVFADFEGAVDNNECNFLKTVPAEQKTFFNDIVGDPVINSCLNK